MTADELDVQMEILFEDLADELGDRVDHDEVLAVGHRYYDELRRNATIHDFIPLLVHRFTKDELVRSSRKRLSDAA
jgi:hypothetical protein